MVAKISWQMMIFSFITILVSSLCVCVICLRASHFVFPSCLTFVSRGSDGAVLAGVMIVATTVIAVFLHLFPPVSVDGEVGRWDLVDSRVATFVASFAICVVSALMAVFSSLSRVWNVTFALSNVLMLNWYVDMFARILSNVFIALSCDAPLAPYIPFSAD